MFIEYQIIYWYQALLAMVLSVTGISVIGHVLYDTHTHMYIPSIVFELALPVITVTINMLSINQSLHVHVLTFNGSRLTASM